jgi:hypothetical protein
MIISKLYGVQIFSESNNRGTVASLGRPLKIGTLRSNPFGNSVLNPGDRNPQDTLPTHEATPEAVAIVQRATDTVTISIQDSEFYRIRSSSSCSKHQGHPKTGRADLQLCCDVAKNGWRICKPGCSGRESSLGKELFLNADCSDARRMNCVRNNKKQVNGMIRWFESTWHRLKKRIAFGRKELVRPYLPWVGMQNIIDTIDRSRDNCDRLVNGEMSLKSYLDWYFRGLDDIISCEKLVCRT